MYRMYGTQFNLNILRVVKMVKRNINYVDKYV